MSVVLELLIQQLGVAYVQDESAGLVGGAGTNQFPQCSLRMSLSGVFFGAMEFLAMFLLPIILGRLSHFATFRGGRQWYRNLKKPPFTPPGWVFGLAWAIVHPCMGLSSYLILREGGWAAQSLPLALYGIQLLLNATWSPIFFYLRWIDVVRRIKQLGTVSKQPGT